jgi:hypothetical protein
LSVFRTKTIKETIMTMGTDVEYAAQDGWKITVATYQVCLACLIESDGGVTVNTQDKLILVMNHEPVPTAAQCAYHDEDGHE